MELRERTTGRWPTILTSLGVAPQYLRNKHMPCPGCGGRDRFRFDDKGGRGTFYCGGGGNPVAGDGFTLLNHLYGWDFKTAADAVRQVLGIEADKKRHLRDNVIPTTVPEVSKTLPYAKRLWAAANNNDDHVAEHPYCLQKGIDRAYGAARCVVSGSIVGHNSDCIAVPMRSLEGNFKGAEVIGIPVWDAKAKKHVTPKQTFGSKGVLVLGNSLDLTIPVYIVEGWADGVSLWRQLGDVVVMVVFGDRKRQDHYAHGLNEHNPARDYILVRDA